MLESLGVLLESATYTLVDPVCKPVKLDEPVMLLTAVEPAELVKPVGLVEPVALAVEPDTRATATASSELVVVDLHVLAVEVISASLAPGARGEQAPVTLGPGPAGAELEAGQGGGTATACSSLLRRKGRSSFGSNVRFLLSCCALILRFSLAFSKYTFLSFCFSFFH